MSRRLNRDTIRTVVSLAAIVAGLAFLAWPVVCEMLVAMRAEQSISEIEGVYDAMSDDARSENVAQARAYNMQLRGEDPGIDVWDYDSQLTYHDEPSTMMAWLEIPKIGSKLPVYHHTTETVLMAGVGHIDTTSLPVGGEGNLCALSGHSGMQNARMFDDIRFLDKGDEFVVWTLKDPYAYRVCDIRTVLPDEDELLKRQPGRDLCLLITCTPYNVNTHRLIIVGERCEYDPTSDKMAKSIESVANRRTLPLIVTTAVVVAVAATVALRRHAARRQKSGEGTSVKETGTDGDPDDQEASTRKKPVDEGVRME